MSLEVEGGYHLKKEQKEKYIERTAYLKSVGIIEYKFTTLQILYQYKTVINKIKSYLREDAPFKDEGERRLKKL